MGKVLQIRVSAVTWDEDLVEKQWPQLTELAFSVPITHEKRGVLEMVRALREGIKFMDWPEPRRAALHTGIGQVAETVQKLEKALADWDPREANRLSDELESQLDALEAAYC